MTEEEALTKWCPIIMSPSSIDRGMTTMPMRSRAHGANCIGSACMMWREIISDDLYRLEVIQEEPRMVKVVGGPTVIAGYCGLAGKP